MKSKTTANDNPSSPDAEARHEARERSKVNALASWQRFLRENRAGAIDAVNAAVKRMGEARIFHHAEIAQFRAQMLNGVAVPDDFLGGTVAAHSRA